MIAGQVPANAFTIMLTVLKLMFYPPNAACRLDDEITRVALNYVFMIPKPVTDREKKIPAGPLLLFDNDAGDWPEAGDFTGGKHDRHASADDFQA